MTVWQHGDTMSARWQRLSLAEQFGNVGSEISRAIRRMFGILEILYADI